MDTQYFDSTPSKKLENKLFLLDFMLRSDLIGVSDFKVLLQSLTAIHWHVLSHRSSQPQQLVFAPQNLLHCK